MRFICLGYTDERQWNAMSQREQDEAIERCFAYDMELLQAGHWLEGGSALQGTHTAKTLRYRDGKVVVTDGPFAETKEQLGGIGVFAAKDMDQAVELWSRHPGTQFGLFEVRPADEAMNASSATGRAAEAAANQHGERFVCLGYVQETKWAAMSKDERDAMLERYIAFDRMLRDNGHLLASEPLQSVRTAKTIRSRDGRALVTDGPFAETKEQLGGAIVIAARDINHAVDLMSNHPAIGFAFTLEIRPVNEDFNTRWDERARAVS